MRARLIAVALLARDSHAQRALPEYRYFRSLSIDLLGRPPTCGEIAAFEQPGFDLERWLDARPAVRGADPPDLYRSLAARAVGGRQRVPATFGPLAVDDDPGPRRS